MADILTDALGGITSTINSTNSVTSAIGGSPNFNTDPNVLASSYRSAGIPAGADVSLNTNYVGAQYSNPARSEEHTSELQSH